MKFRQWCYDFLETYKKPFLKPSTYQRYIVALVYVPEKLKLEKLTAKKIQKIINGMLERNLSASTIKQTMTVMRQALVKAKRLGMIDSLAMLEELELPKAERVRVHAFSLAEQEAFLQACENSFYGNLFKALLYTGARIGELIALEWRDVNLKGKYIRINKTDYRGQITAPKTKEGIRNIPIIDPMLDVLARQNPFRDGLVFRNSFGLPLKYRSVLDCYYRVLERAGIEHCGLHVLRHTFATRALSAGVNVKALSQWLGHSDVSITLNIYTDVDESEMKKAARIIGGFFQPGATGTRAL